VTCLLGFKFPFTFGGFIGEQKLFFKGPFAKDDPSAILAVLFDDLRQRLGLVALSAFVFRGDLGATTVRDAIHHHETPACYRNKVAHNMEKTSGMWLVQRFIHGKQLSRTPDGVALSLTALPELMKLLIFRATMGMIDTNFANIMWDPVDRRVVSVDETLREHNLPPPLQVWCKPQAAKRQVLAALASESSKELQKASLVSFCATFQRLLKNDERVKKLWNDAGQKEKWKRAISRLEEISAAIPKGKFFRAPE